MRASRRGPLRAVGPRNLWTTLQLGTLAGYFGRLAGLMHVDDCDFDERDPDAGSDKTEERRGAQVQSQRAGVGADDGACATL